MRTLFFAVALALLSALQANANQFTDDDWTVYSLPDPDGACLMGRSLGQGVDFLLYGNSFDGFGIGIKDPARSSSPPNAASAISGAIYVDTGPPHVLQGNSVDAETVMFDGAQVVGDPEELGNMLRSGKTAMLSVEARPYRVDLSGISEGLKVLYACIEQSIGTASAPPKTISYGSRAGMDVEVMEITGADTSLAEMTTRHTRENAKAYCVEYDGDTTEACVDRTLADVANSGIRNRAIANCESGEFTDLYGKRYRFEGPRADSEAIADYRLRDIKENRVLDGSMASGYGTALSALAALCPAKVPSR